MRQKKIKSSKVVKKVQHLGITNTAEKVLLLSKETDKDLSNLFFAESKNGFSFSKQKNKIKVVSGLNKEENFELSDYAHLASYDKVHCLTYLQRVKKEKVLKCAVSKDLKRFNVIGRISKIQEKGVLVSNYKLNGNHVLYFGESSIGTATSKNLKSWRVSKLLALQPRGNSFDHARLNVLGAALTANGILVVYDCSYPDSAGQVLQIGAALFSLSNPTELIWRSDNPLWRETLPVGHKRLFPLGAAIFKEEIFVYYISADGELVTVTIAQVFPSVKAKKALVRLKRFYKNPIISPSDLNEWESEATFNPAALYDDGKVHLLYRAVGKSGLSCFGYASSKDGFHINESCSEPAYIPRKEFEGVHTKPKCYTDLYKSGCGWGGCEDPKLTAIEDKIYLTYVAYNGYSHPRVALSSIDRSDFLKKKWNWKEPVLISPPGVVDKSGCILPEKIQGKYVIFHRIFPHILIDYRDDLSFDDGKWLETKHKITTRPGMWDSRKLSVGATPIKTPEGWLVIYHAVDDKDDSRYKVGAMILDYKDPSRVIYRTSNPILEPEEPYENEGKFGVVYPCGAVVLDDELFVYYGGGDKVVCCATVQLDKLIKGIKKDTQITYKLKEVVLN